ncbi:MAG: MgtC/SapB family protein [Thermomicrobiales bacterium]|jgi:putative Mg2+ transporter-C (MgtC) family protein|nr:MgtC/SapB family protein [Thermomicrobiales bacterium]
MSGTLEISTTQILLRLGTAAILGALVGLERERLERAAGLRTHALVAVASATVMITSAFGFSDTLTPDRLVSLDPSRVAAQVVSGIGFLGAGVIIFRKNAVRGLTTAASVWSVAGLGLASGGGLYVLAISATAIILFIQAGLRPLERRLFVHHQEHQLVLRVRHGAGALAAVESALTAVDVEVRGLRLRPVRGGAEDRVELDLGTVRRVAMTTLLDALRTTDGVRLVNYSRGAARLVAADPEDAAEGLGPEDEDLAEYHDAKHRA